MTIILNYHIEIYKIKCLGTSEEVLIRTENDKPKVQPTKPVIQISKTGRLLF